MKFFIDTANVEDIKEAKEFIDGCMDHLTVEMTDHAKWQLRAAMTRAAELAEQEAEERMRQKR